MGKFSFTGASLRLRGYHDTPSWNSIGSGDITVGMEMEVAGFRDRGEVISALTQEGMTERFMLATTDSSIGGSGIEWVTQPIGIDYLESEGFDIIGQSLEIMASHGGKGIDAHVSCGCHHNFSCDSLPNSRKVWVPAMEAVFKYYDTVFKKFSGKNRSDNYARIPDSGNFERYCQENGKYAFFNHRSSGVMEMRFPGMVMDPGMFRAQTRLCTSAARVAMDVHKGHDIDVGDMTFLELFKPKDEDLEVLSKMGVHSRVLEGKH